MPSNLKVLEEILGGANVVIGASETDTVVSEEFNVSSEGSLNLRVDIKSTAAVVAAGINLKLQYGLPDGSFADVKTVAVTIAGVNTITMNIEVAGDQSFLPLRKICRVVVSSGAGD